MGMAKISNTEKELFLGIVVAVGGLLTPKHRQRLAYFLLVIAVIIGAHMIWTIFQPVEKTVTAPGMRVKISGHHNSIGSVGQSGGQTQQVTGSGPAIQANGNVYYNSQNEGGENLKIEPVRRHEDNNGRPFDQFSIAITNIGSEKVVFKKETVYCNGKEMGSRDHSEGFEGAVGGGEIWSQEDPIFFDPKNRSSLAHWQQCKGILSVILITSRDNKFQGVFENQ
jgi:hypothetical protein